MKHTDCEELNTAHSPDSLPQEAAVECETPTAQRGESHRSGGNTEPGAPSSNTAPVNSMEGSSVRCLRYGIDSLYLSYPGNSFASVSLSLNELKKAAQSEGSLQKAEAIYLLPGHRFEVNGRGAGRFPYVLIDNAYRISLAGAKAGKLPLAYIQVKSHWLTAHGVDKVVSELDELIPHFGLVADDPGVSRVDLFVDFVTDLPLDELHRGQWVTRAKRISSHSVDGAASGYSIGLGGDMSARLYDKTLQVKSSGQDYLYDLWRSAGWDGSQTVWRLEFQFEQRILTEHDVRSVSALLMRLGPLWLYAMTQWLRLTLPGTDKTRSRWLTHPAWEALSAVAWAGSENGASIPVRAERLPSEHKLFVNGVVGITSYMAVEGITDYREAFNRFCEAARCYHDARSHITLQDFANYLREKAAIKAKRYNCPYPGVDERAEARTRAAVAEAYRKSSDGE